MLNRSLTAACGAGTAAPEDVLREVLREAAVRDGVAADGAVENVGCCVAAAVEPENTCWPEDDVTVLAALLLLPALPPLLDVVPPDFGGLVRSAEAGASLRATLGDLNAGAVLADSADGAAAAGVLDCAGAAAGVGAATVNDAGANPPVGREADTE